MHKSYKRLQQYIERGTGSTNFFQRMLSFLSWRWRKAMSHSLRCSMMLQDSCSSQPPLCKEKKCSGTSGRCHKRFPGTRSTYVNSCGQCFRLWWMLIDVDLCATRDSDLDSSICKKKKIQKNAPSLRQSAQVLSSPYDISTFVIHDSNPILRRSWNSHAKMLC